MVELAIFISVFIFFFFAYLLSGEPVLAVRRSELWFLFVVLFVVFLRGVHPVAFARSGLIPSALGATIFSFMSWFFVIVFPLVFFVFGFSYIDLSLNLKPFSSFLHFSTVGFITLRIIVLNCVGV